MQQLAHTSYAITTHLSPEFISWLNQEKKLAHRRQKLALGFGFIFLFVLVMAFAVG